MIPGIINAGPHSMQKLASLLCSATLLLSVSAMQSRGSTTHYVSPTGLHIAPFASWADAATNIQAAVDAAGSGGIVLVTNGTYSPFIGFETKIMTSSNAPAPVWVTASTFTGAGNHAWRAFTADGHWTLPVWTTDQWLQYDSGVPNGLQIDSYQMISPNQGSGDQSIAEWEIQVSHDGTNWIPVDARSEVLLENYHYYFAVQQPATAQWVRLYITAVTDPATLTTLRIAFGHHLRVTSVNGPDHTVIDADGQPGVWLGTARMDGFRVINALNYGVLHGDIRHCVITNITGAGISTARFVDQCYLANNSLYGVMNSLVVQNSTIEWNQVLGVLNCSLVERCMIRENGTPAGNGGGVFMGAGAPEGAVLSSHIVSNRAGNGAGVFMTSGTVANCFINGNIASARGGGVYAGTGRAWNCTIVGNTAGEDGGGSYSTEVRNSIVYGNWGASRSNHWGGSLSFCFTMPAPSVGSNNRLIEPGLLQLSSPRLAATSPCISAGSPSFALGNEDIDGEPRVWGEGVEVGCDEVYPPGLTGALSVNLTSNFERSIAGFPIDFHHTIEGRVAGFIFDTGDGTVVTNWHTLRHTYQTPGVYEAVITVWNLSGMASTTTSVEILNGYTNYVSPSGGHVPPYTNWAAAATNLQAAIDANIPGAVTLVDDGIYDQGGAVVSGGLLNRAALTNMVTLRSVNGPAVTAIVGQGPLGADAVRCAYVGNESRLEGFTLLNGHTRANPFLAQEVLNGGALWMTAAGTASNCVITGSAASGWGGGVTGGTLWNSIVTSNTAMAGGGGYLCAMINCEIEGNTALEDGGGAFGASLLNCIVFDNAAEYGGGTAYSTNLHSTISRNHAAASGGGVYWSSVRNSIVYHNTASESWPEFFNSILTYTCTSPDPDGTGSITNDPQFADWSGGDFRLDNASPCIDAALDAGSPLFAIDGAPRPLDGNGDSVAGADMGAYEFIGTLSDTDGDGLSDWDELYVHGTNPFAADTDGDGHRDGAEIIADTDPLDPSSVFAIIWADGSDPSNLVISWSARAGRLYSIMTGQQIGHVMTNHPAFTDLPGQDGIMSFTNAISAETEIYGVEVKLAP